MLRSVSQRAASTSAMNATWASVPSAWPSAASSPWAWPPPPCSDASAEVITVVARARAATANRAGAMRPTARRPGAMRMRAATSTAAIWRATAVPSTMVTSSTTPECSPTGRPTVRLHSQSTGDGQVADDHRLVEVAPGPVGQDQAGHDELEPADDGEAEGVEQVPAGVAGHHGQVDHPGSGGQPGHGPPEVDAPGVGGGGPSGGATATSDMTAPREVCRAAHRHILHRSCELRQTRVRCRLRSLDHRPCPRHRDRITRALATGGSRRRSGEPRSRLRAGRCRSGRPCRPRRRPSPGCSVTCLAVRRRRPPATPHRGPAGAVDEGVGGHRSSARGEAQGPGGTPVWVTETAHRAATSPGSTDRGEGAVPERGRPTDPGRPRRSTAPRRPRRSPAPTPPGARPRPHLGRGRARPRRSTGRRPPVAGRLGADHDRVQVHRRRGRRRCGAGRRPRPGGRPGRAGRP